jgi:transcriptional regulator with GAF, ATPase, and Fis domain
MNPCSQAAQHDREQKVPQAGRVKDLSVDVRFIAATNGTWLRPWKGVSERLYYRLKVFPFSFPLRERLSDLPSS